MPHRPQRPTGADMAVAPSAYGAHHPASIMRPNPSGSYAHPGFYYPSGVVTPIPKAKSNNWITSTVPARDIPSLDSPSKCSESADPSTGTKHDDSTVGTLNTEGTNEDLEATASALLQLDAREQSDKQGDKDSDNESSSSGSVPLKKRKSFLRPKSTADNDTVKNNADPCHVSPVSQSSRGSVRVGGRTISKEESSPERTISTNSARSNSYDSAEVNYRQTRPTATQALLDSSKVRNATDIAPSSQAPHFPTILHQVLSDSSNNGIVQWLPEGESWKVLRWDALSRQILPRYFPNLKDENGEGSGTIDAFLWHLTTWGFEEMKDGSSVGAYRHNLFIRGAQKLCSKMRSSVVPTDESQKEQQMPKTISPSRDESMGRSMLQVPSLSTIDTRDRDSSGSPTPNKRARHGEAYSPSWGSPSSDTSGWGHFYSEASRIGMRHATGQNSSPAYDPRYQTSQTCQPYSPPQVTRSGRGALRLPSSSRGPVKSTSSPRTSFPVSNRGKGSRKNMLCRPSISATKFVEASKPAMLGMGEIKCVGAAQHGVAMAVSRKTKRKLPFAQKTVLNA